MDLNRSVSLRTVGQSSNSCTFVGVADIDKAAKRHMRRVTASVFISVNQTPSVSKITNTVTNQSVAALGSPGSSGIGIGSDEYRRMWSLQRLGFYGLIHACDLDCAVLPGAQDKIEIFPEPQLRGFGRHVVSR